MAICEAPWVDEGYKVDARENMQQTTARPRPPSTFTDMVNKEKSLLCSGHSVSKADMYSRATYLRWLKAYKMPHPRKKPRAAQIGDHGSS